MSISSNIEHIGQQIAEACVRSGRDPSEITLVAATKTVPVERIKEAIAGGIIAVGENRAQEVQEKFPELVGVSKHFIGHLQTNKVDVVVRHCDMIESVDSVKLLDAIDTAAAKWNKKMNVLLEIDFYHHVKEVERTGFEPKHIRSRVLEHAKTLSNIQVCGLMTIPLPNLTEPEIRHVFQALRILRNAEETQTGMKLPELSMGMSEDYPIAIEEGATIVRLGRAIFGERVY